MELKCEGEENHHLHTATQGEGRAPCSPGVRAGRRRSRTCMIKNRMLMTRAISAYTK